MLLFLAIMLYFLGGLLYLAVCEYVLKEEGETDKSIINMTKMSVIVWPLIALAGVVWDIYDMLSGKK